MCSNTDLKRIIEFSIRLRACRKACALALPMNFTGEPAFDILLEAFVARGQDKTLSILEMCTATNIPRTSALRWFKELEASGYLLRNGSNLDGRKVLVELTEFGVKSMQRSLRAALEQMGYYAKA